MSEQYEAIISDEALDGSDATAVDAELGDGAQHTGGVNITDGTSNT